MKSTIKLLLLILVVTFINACSTTEKKQEDQGEIQKAVLANCTIDDDEIPDSTAITMISEAQTYIKSVNDNLDPGAIQIPYGAKIPVCEMKEILNKLGNTPETWAMMAMENDELTIIFQGKKHGTEEYVYYDFTHPCPNKCPESASELN